jgi:hypothetical protein
LANGVQKQPAGPFWPLGSIVVVTPGTPVRITSLIDPTNINAPETATSSSSDEYTRRANQIIIQGVKTNGGTGTTNNTGNIYVIVKGSPSPGSNNRTDMGCIVLTVASGQTAVLAASPLNRDAFTPYQLWIDADNANDAATVTLIIQ